MRFGGTNFRLRAVVQALFLGGATLASALAGGDSSTPSDPAHAEALTAKAPDTRLAQFDSAGIHFGVGQDHLSRQFRELEAVSDWKFSSKLDCGRDWELKPRLELSLGELRNNHRSAVIGSAGGVLSLGPAHLPVALEGGFAVAGVSEHDFETRDLGGCLQFRSRIGVAWTVAKHLRLAYHFQHMSNGGLTNRNPGLNMHTFTVAWRL